MVAKMYSSGDNVSINIWVSITINKQNRKAPPKDNTISNTVE